MGGGGGSFTCCAGWNNVLSNAVDIFDVKTGAWTTAALSVARSSLVATSLPSDGVAIFAGGLSALRFLSCALFIAGRSIFDISVEGGKGGGLGAYSSREGLCGVF